jgi:hypothetical protein
MALWCLIFSIALRCIFSIAPRCIFQFCAHMAMWYSFLKILRVSFQLHQLFMLSGNIGRWEYHVLPVLVSLGPRPPPGRSEMSFFCRGLLCLYVPYTNSILWFPVPWCNMAPTAKAICTCTSHGCSKRTYAKDGVIKEGQRVDPATQTAHCLQDEQNRLIVQSAAAISK